MIQQEPHTVQLIECPRDAMQGWKRLIPTEQKVRYINALLQVGFHTIDFGSFVSPKAIPQMADTKEVIPQLDLSGTQSKLLAIIANLRGAEEAVQYEAINYLGFPFSISETFQQRNTNSSVEESLRRVEDIQALCVQHNKQLVIYISMGFGNPYGDPWSEEIVFQWTDRMVQLGIPVISLADTVGLASPEQVFSVTQYMTQQFPEQEIGVHLHSTPVNWRAKVEAAYSAGCRRFDGALRGIGGCPMAKDELVGNMNTENMIACFEEKGVLGPLDRTALQNALQIAAEIFV